MGGVVVKLLLIGTGGFLGALARYGISAALHRSYDGPFPVGTLAVNVVGCFAAGLVMYFVDHRDALTPETRHFVTVGLLGALTTFSTFGYETIQLLRDGRAAHALASVALNVLLGLGAVWLGWMLSKGLG